MWSKEAKKRHQLRRTQTSLRVGNSVIEHFAYPKNLMGLHCVWEILGVASEG